MTAIDETISNDIRPRLIRDMTEREKHLRRVAKTALGEGRRKVREAQAELKRAEKLAASNETEADKLKAAIKELRRSN